LRKPFNHFSFLAPSYETFIKPHQPERLLTLINLPIQGKILDAGGGTGRVAQFLRNKSARIVIADQSFEMLQVAQQKKGLQPVCSNSEMLPFPDNYFERIMMVDALHHVNHHQLTGDELWRVLKPGGRIVIEEPDLRKFGVKLLALAEKLAMMRSHFLAPAEIAGLFSSPMAKTSYESEGATAWIIIEKTAA
jgi:demethylmenaquinone methyltransferase/2-methoxy-6-polyprenyl-1,4-benzoquinol methylase